MLETPGKKENINYERQFQTPVVATQSLQKKLSRVKQLKGTMQDVDFEIQQKFATSDSKNMCLSSNTTCASTLNTTCIMSKQCDSRAPKLPPVRFPRHLRVYVEAYGRRAFQTLT